MGLRFSQVIDAPPDIVFDCLERPDLVQQWMAGVERIEDTSPPDLTGPVGGRFRLWIREGRKVGVYDGEVLRCDRPSQFGIRFGNDRFLSRVTYRLDPAGDATELSYEAEFERAGVGLRLLTTVFAPMTRSILARQMAALKTLAETRAKGRSD